MSEATPAPRVFSALAVGAAALGPWLPDPLPVTAMLGLAVVILLSGVPHGGLDPLLASRWMRGAQPGRWLLFLVCYLLPVALMVGLWWLSPATFLLVFLLLSVHHFGGDLAPGTATARRLMHGATLIVLPALLYPQTLAQLFGTIAPEFAPGWVSALQAASLPFLAVATLDALWCAWRGDTDGQPRVLLTLAAVLSPPLLSFAIYFCAWHAPRHVGELRRRLQPWPRAARAISAACVAAVIGVAGLAWWLLPAGDPPRFVIASLFIGLGALTLPHMILVERFHAQVSP